MFNATLLTLLPKPSTPIGQAPMREEHEELNDSEKRSACAAYQQPLRCVFFASALLAFAAVCLYPSRLVSRPAPPPKPSGSMTGPSALIRQAISARSCNPRNLSVWQVPPLPSSFRAHGNQAAADSVFSLQVLAYVRAFSHALSQQRTFVTEQVMSLP